MTDAIRGSAASLSASIDLLLDQLELLADYQFKELRPLEAWRVELRANLDLWRVELLEPEGERSTWLRAATGEILETIAGLASALSASSHQLFGHMADRGFEGAANRFIGSTGLITILFN